MRPALGNIARRSSRRSICSRASNPSLEQIKSLAGQLSVQPDAAALDRAQILPQAGTIVPPQEFQPTHALLVSAVQLAGNAARIRREATLADDIRPRLGCLVRGRRRAHARRPGQSGHAEAAAPPATPVITPRRTRLVRVPDLHAFRHAIVGLSLAGDPDRLPIASSSFRLTAPRASCGECCGGRRSADARDARRALRWPSRAARHSRRRADARTTATSWCSRRRATPQRHSGPAVRCDRASSPRCCASTISCAARRGTSRASRSFSTRRLSRDAEHDRGAERMLAQARFLAETFHGYERRVVASGACDEHDAPRTADATSLDQSGSRNRRDGWRLDRGSERACTWRTSIC